MTTMNKLVRENMEDVLKPKSKSDIKDSTAERIRDLQDMDVDDMVEAMVQDFASYGPIEEDEVMRTIIMNIEVPDRKQIIKEVYLTFVEYLVNIDEMYPDEETS